ncbi:CAMK family protein kinase [Tritrichomonas foetus]|uniref:CAMK family protein kinase n=1 Tax=Tritrichomonas foetus TaxID=1144522 RepID=A0A1J4K5N8_9EUKA|nr:CAMK family protein kinase [Tritrichomonas foetus]|eukprot:OHT06192.1 CAMK family protein kinase [Tritrichomonas foetus]
MSNKIDSKIQEILGIHHYKALTQIGKGGFSTVYLVEHLLCHTFYAIKITDVNDKKWSIIQYYRQEVQNLKKLAHKNIIHLYDAFETDEYLFMVLEYCQYGTIIEFLKQSNSSVNTRYLYYQIIKAVQYIHSLRIAHLDIKPANILVDANGTPKLSDFGLSTVVLSYNNQISNYCGSPLYSPPEMKKDSSYDAFCSDIWSLGVTIYEIASGRSPYKCLQRVNWEQLLEESHFGSDEFSDVLKSMIVVNPNMRKQCGEVLKMPLFKNLISYAPSLKSTSKPKITRNIIIKNKSVTAVGHISYRSNISLANYSLSRSYYTFKGNSNLESID